PSKIDNVVMSLLSYFTRNNFEKTIHGYCQEIGWTISKVDADYARLSFEMESGREQSLHIIRFDSTLEFSVPSQVAFEEGDEIPGWISTLLMRNNSKFKVGFWCIETINSRSVYSVMHNAEQSLMDRDYFASIVRRLVGACDDFETSLEEMMTDAEKEDEDSDDDV
ncbi:MAG: hypothetical protein Q8M07_26495, partial [Prosthecobacter sp.]|nr:hypothetical protein [Prosthecobacter sp.]